MDVRMTFTTGFQVCICNFIFFSCDFDMFHVFVLAPPPNSYFATPLHLAGRARNFSKSHGLYMGRVFPSYFVIFSAYFFISSYFLHISSYTSFIFHNFFIFLHTIFFISPSYFFILSSYFFIFLHIFFIFPSYLFHIPSY